MEPLEDLEVAVVTDFTEAEAVNYLLSESGSLIYEVFEEYAVWIAKGASRREACYHSLSSWCK